MGGNYSSANFDDCLYTFAVDQVKAADKPPSSLVNAETVVRLSLGVNGKFEDFSHRKDENQHFVMDDMSGFMLTLHTAYQNHYGLKLSVSDFIILIGQGLSKHINNNSEELRKYFVSHEGKEKIEIKRDEFVLGQQNDWSTVFGEFGLEIKKRVKSDIYDVVIDDTSIATKDSRIVSEITLMDAMQSYFDYTVTTMCGIPQITLEGRKDDWEKLRGKVRKLVEMNKDDCLMLNWWLKHLVPVVEKICDTATNRKANKSFWSGIYKYTNPGSGTPYISGWCTVFFPYLCENNKNPLTTPAKISTGEIPKQISKVPFIWKYMMKEIPMHFYGGFIGAQYNKEDNSVQPKYFWSVVYDEDKKADDEKI